MWCLHLIPTAKFECMVKKCKIKPVKYFNKWLLNYKQKFSLDSVYIFCNAASKPEYHISIAMKNLCTKQFNVGLLSRHLSDALNAFIVQDEWYGFMTPINSSILETNYFQSCSYGETHLGLLTLFMTLRCVELSGMSLSPLFQNWTEKSLERRNLMT